MWQFIGLALFLGLLAILQLIWPWPLPGLNTAPALLLLSGSLVLFRMPLGRLYVWLLLLAAGFDLLLGDGPYCLLGYAMTLMPAFLRPVSEHIPGWLPSLGWMLGSVLLFDLILAMLSSFRGPGAWPMLLHHLPWTLAYNLLAALLLLPITGGLISLLHYQRFEYLKEARRGKLG
ncbi:MAG: hypothetical protein CVV27_18425 [Candidatus Melainabacteria bacterium HGW-Melainabacteria-1]|nr:MAG: hypothetical protein CVV27_18425 [Candidatus Melainabacteria bacterium HGW-Melainabacteria-1]